MFLEDDDDMNACGCGEEDCEECADAGEVKDADKDADDDYGDGRDL